VSHPYTDPNWRDLDLDTRCELVDAWHATQPAGPEELHSATGLSVTIDRSEVDGVLVVFIDGADGHDAGDGGGGVENERGPVLRILLNDAPVFANPPFDHSLAEHRWSTHVASQEQEEGS
jgi:hypothetical protein